MELAKIEVNDFGGSPFAEHNMPCPIFWTEEKAVYNLSTGIFHPSRAAKSFGWRLVKCDNWFRKKLIKWFFPENVK